MASTSRSYLPWNRAVRASVRGPNFPSSTRGSGQSNMWILSAACRYFTAGPTSPFDNMTTSLCWGPGASGDDPLPPLHAGWSRRGGVWFTKWVDNRPPSSSGISGQMSALMRRVNKIATVEMRRPCRPAGSGPEADRRSEARLWLVGYRAQAPWVHWRPKQSKKVFEESEDEEIALGQVP